MTDYTEYAKKTFWGKLFSSTKSKDQAFKIADKILKKLGLWSWSWATEQNFNDAINMVDNFVEGKIDTETEYRSIKDEPINNLSTIL